MAGFLFHLFLHSQNGIQQCIFSSKEGDSVAQLVEQYTFNVWVLGSSPSGITKRKVTNDRSLFLFSNLILARFGRASRFYREGPGFESQRDH